MPVRRHLRRDRRFPHGVQWAGRILSALRTAILGAILLAGYLGGAAASSTDSGCWFRYFYFLSCWACCYEADSGYATSAFTNCCRLKRVRREERTPILLAYAR